MAITPQGIEAHAQSYAINTDILYAADFLATMAKIQALNDDLIEKCAIEYCTLHDYCRDYRLHLRRLLSPVKYPI